MLEMEVQKLSDNAISPKRATEGSAGYDLCSAYEYTINARERKLIKTDLAISIPEKCYGRIAPRSGLALKNGIDVGAGVIDSDYRGNVGVVIFNHSDVPFIVHQGDRIAQLLIIPILIPEIKEVENLSTTQRGEKGFGSTG